MFFGAITASVLIGFAGGVAINFVESARRLVYVLTFGSVAAIASTIILVAGVAGNPLSLSIGGVFLCVAYFFFWFGKTLAKPFVEIRQEQQADQLSETFK